MDGLEGRARLRVRPAEEREVPQRRPGDRGRREVLVRALQGRRGQAAQGPRARRRDRGRRARALPPPRGVAGLHDVLRHVRHRRGVDRAAQVRGEGGRRRLQEGADRRGPLPGGELQPGRRPGDGSLRGLLEKGPVGEAPRLPQHARRDDAGRRAQDGRRGHRLSPERAHRPGGQAHAGAAPRRRHAARRDLPRPARAVGSEVAVARPARAAGGEPRPRPRRAEPGRDARPLAPHRRPHPARARLRARLRRRPPTIRRGPRSSWPRRAIPTASTRAT